MRKQKKNPGLGKLRETGLQRMGIGHVFMMKPKPTQVAVALNSGSRGGGQKVSCLPPDSFVMD